MPEFSIGAARAGLAKLIARAAAGEDIVITRPSVPVARLVPVRVATAQGRKFGAMRGRATVTQAFFEPLPDEELDEWQQ